MITINGKEISIAIVVGFFDVDLIKFILLFFFLACKERGQANLKGIDKMKQQECKSFEDNEDERLMVNVNPLEKVLFPKSEIVVMKHP